MNAGQTNYPLDTLSLYANIIMSPLIICLDSHHQSENCISENPNFPAMLGTSQLFVKSTRLKNPLSLPALSPDIPPDRLSENPNGARLPPADDRRIVGIVDQISTFQFEIVIKTGLNHISR
jgi:hypothetical protein